MSKEQYTLSHDRVTIDDTRLLARLHLLHLGGEVLLRLLLGGLADVEADEARHLDVLAQLGDVPLDHLLTDMSVSRMYGCAISSLVLIDLSTRPVTIFSMMF